jgi:hypothetical protein
MPILWTAPLNGTVMSASDMLIEFDKGLEFINGGISTSDISTASLTYAEVFKPEFQGWPVDGMDAVTQLAAARAVTSDRRAWDEKRNRVDIFPGQQNTDGWVKVPQMEWTGYLTHYDYIEMVATWEALEVHDPLKGNTYPAAAGYFMVGVRDRTDNSINWIEETRRDLFSAYIVNDPLITTFSTFGYEAIGLVGNREYDVFLAYFATGAHADVHQVSVGYRTFLVEVLQDQT